MGMGGNNNLDTSWSSKVEFLELKTLRAGAAKQEDVEWPEKKSGRSLPST